MLTEKLSRFVVGTRFKDLPAAAVDKAKFHILDCLGVILAGSRQPAALKVKTYVQSLGGKDQAGIIGGLRAAAPQAAFANATMGHLLDFDDDSDTSASHPSVTVLPAVIALSRGTTSGRDLLRAYILGIEAGARIGAMPGFLPDHYRRGWHTTATIGVLGATAGCGAMLSLNTNQLRTALGIAASEAGGLRANFGSAMKAVHAGSAAAKAVSSVLLARAGITANPRILEDPRGYYALFGSLTDLDQKAVLSDLGSRFDIVSPGINLKKYPCCYYTHAAIDALLQLTAQHGLTAEDAAEIQCTLSAIACEVLQYKRPETGIQAKFSLPYCLARALVSRQVGIDDFADAALQQKDVRRIMPRVTAAPDPSLDAADQTLAARLCLVTAGGERLYHEMIKAPGSSENPLSWREVTAKFTTCARRVLSEHHTTDIIAAVERLEHLERIDVLLEPLFQTAGV